MRIFPVAFIIAFAAAIAAMSAAAMSAAAQESKITLKPGPGPPAALNNVRRVNIAILPLEVLGAWFGASTCNRYSQRLAREKYGIKYYVRSMLFLTALM